MILAFNLLIYNKFVLFFVFVILREMVIVFKRRQHHFFLLAGEWLNYPEKIS